MILEVSFSEKLNIPAHHFYWKLQPASMLLDQI